MRSAGNVRHVTSDHRAHMHIHAQARLELFVLEENEITFTVEVKTVSLPRLEMRIPLGDYIIGIIGIGSRKTTDTVFVSDSVFVVF
mgnify:CR=1 FL=1